ncbi:hypothetical protein A6V39_03390 [Candidatus Mycoplasma haematobovis]|uniref:Uncharacterized protein n=1 Tax=Candidatus Mycoplasma haematobovis TaxID=432608 RepID=A0A1A9QE02_9MOLU|nr:hypothetical protein [Candidatus Mycoplasma haematobovis]OAL09929.1 hypothetical protein A6V39_03390 [Candidatus Mycoplasma haematobovis]
MKFKKYLLVATKVIVVSAIPAYRIWKLSRPTLGTLLKQEGYRTIFDSERPTFDKWMKLFLFFKKDLINDNIVSANLMSDSEGAFVFKNWCAKSLESNDSNFLGKARKYCSMNLGVYALEKEGAKLIQDISEKKQRKAWFYSFGKYKDEIIRSGFFSGIMGDSQENSENRLRDWCSDNSKKMYLPKNYLIAEHVAIWCVMDEKEFNQFNN